MLKEWLLGFVKFHSSPIRPSRFFVEIESLHMSDTFWGDCELQNLKNTLFWLESCFTSIKKKTCRTFKSLLPRQNSQFLMIKIRKSKKRAGWTPTVSIWFSPKPFSDTWVGNLIFSIKFKEATTDFVTLNSQYVFHYLRTVSFFLLAKYSYQYFTIMFEIGFYLCYKGIKKDMPRHYHANSIYVKGNSQ